MIAVNHQRGTVVFDGQPAVFFMAVCDACDEQIRFKGAATRQVWVDEHCVSSGHEVSLALEVRP